MSSNESTSNAAPLGAVSSEKRSAISLRSALRPCTSPRARCASKVDRRSSCAGGACGPASAGATKRPGVKRSSVVVWSIAPACQSANVRARIVGVVGGCGQVEVEVVVERDLRRRRTRAIVRGRTIGRDRDVGRRDGGVAADRAPADRRRRRCRSLTWTKSSALTSGERRRRGISPGSPCPARRMSSDFSVGAAGQHQPVRVEERGRRRAGSRRSSGRSGRSSALADLAVDRPPRRR